MRSSWTRDQTHVPCIGKRILNHWTTREAQQSHVLSCLLCATLSSWIFVGRTDTEAETPKLWPPNAKKPTHWKRPWRWERLRWEKKGTTKDEMIGWDHQLDGHESEQAPGVGDGQGSLTCCSPWGSQRVEHDWVTELKLNVIWFNFHGNLPEISW